MASRKRIPCGPRDVARAVRAAGHGSLNRPNIDLYTPERDGGFGKLHHKLMVIDRHTVVAGSFNYTAPANEYNDENLFVIGSPYEGLPRKEGGPVVKTACAQIADYMRKEIERIVSVSYRWKA